MTEKKLKTYSYLFLLFAFVFFCLFVSMLVRGKFWDNNFITILFLIISLLQLRTAFMFREKAKDPNSEN